VTKRTLSRSAKVTPKTGGRRASNGTPPIDPDSVITSEVSLPDLEDYKETWTGWTLQLSSGGVQHVRVKGGRGRISFSGSGHGEVRIYRNESTKVFDAVFTGVAHVVSDRVEVIPTRMGKHDMGIPEPHFGLMPAEKALKAEVEALTTEVEALTENLSPRITTPPLNPEELFEKETF
jgi:hypothetical protein